MFRSRTITAHFVRGLIGFAFLAILLAYAPRLGWWALIPGAIALLAFRG